MTFHIISLFSRIEATRIISLPFHIILWALFQMTFLIISYDISLIPILYDISPCSTLLRRPALKPQDLSHNLTTGNFVVFMRLTLRSMVDNTKT